MVESLADMVIMEPFRRLARAGTHSSRNGGRQDAAAGPEHTILATRTLTPIATLLAALASRWHSCLGRRCLRRCCHRTSSSSSRASTLIPTTSAAATATAAMCLLAELCTVTVTSIPLGTAGMWRAYTASVFVSMALLALMLAAEAALALRQWRWPDPALPRRPASVGAVWTYLVGASDGLHAESVKGGAGAGLLDQTAELGAVSEERRNDIVTGWDRTYSLEKRASADAAVRWTIDYAE
jgi:hypothetical protein